MSLIGSQQVGLGSVHTAAGDSGSGGASSGAPNAICAKFSGSVGDTDLQTTVYLTDDGDLAGGSAVPMRYPTSARTITALRLSATIGTGSSPPTATLFKNGVATLMTCTLGAGAAPGDNVVDIAHPITFADGDTFDVELTAAAGGEGPAPYTATLEGTGGNVGTGVPYDGDPANVLPPGGTPDPGVSSQFSRGDHVHVLDDLLPFDFTGTYYVFDVDATGALNIIQTPATDGVDFDQHPALRVRRRFDTFPSAGLVATWETQYDAPPPFGVLTPGGSYQVWRNVDTSGNILQFAREDKYTETAFLVQPGYSPSISGATWTYWQTSLLNQRGGGDLSITHFNSDGGHFRKCLLPDGAPHVYNATQLSMAGIGTSAADGSAVSYQVVGPTSNFGDNLELGSFRVYQDSQNYGSAQATGHAEIWARGPTLVDVPAQSAAFYADHVAVPGYATVAGSLSTSLLPLGAGIQGTMISGTLDFLSTTTGALFSPTFAGRYFVPVGIRYLIDSINGTITTGPTTNIGNNVAKNNILASAIQMTAANMNAINTAGAPGLATGFAPLIGQKFVDCGTAFKIDITVAAVANTATVATGRVLLAGFWVAP